MPRLTRQSITVASRIMLPTYVVLFLVLGLIYTFDPGDRLNGVPSLTFQRQVMGGTMTPWGLVFLGLAVVMGVSFTMRSRAWVCFGLCCCSVSMMMWALMYVVSLRLDPTTSYVSPVWPVFVAIACIASVASLAVGEI